MGDFGNETAYLKIVSDGGYLRQLKVLVFLVQGELGEREVVRFGKMSEARIEGASRFVEDKSRGKEMFRTGFPFHPVQERTELFRCAGLVNPEWIIPEYPGAGGIRTIHDLHETGVYPE